MGVVDYRKNRILWRTYCANRMDRAYETNAKKASLAFSAIPFLLHNNHPSLPGFVRFDEPLGGIFNFSQTSSDSNICKELFPNYYFLPYGSGSSDVYKNIHSLLLIGSVGTIAQNDSSDFDYWVVVDKSALSARKMDALSDKLKLVEDWATMAGMEAHFFISDIESVKDNNFGEADKESVGSAQPRALKEEFYRTVILVAGKDPLWWLLPPLLSNREYETEKSALLANGDIGEDEFVDLGNAEPIPKEELYGALLWQLNKATISPHKAALKMALIETVISGDTGISLPCESLKEIIQSQAGPFLSDPYLLMIDYVRNRYLAEKKHEVARSLEQGFYLKCIDSAIDLDKDDDLGDNYKESTLRKLLGFWGWRQDDLGYVNDFNRWNIHKSGELGDRMHNFIMETYKNAYNDMSIRPDLGGLLSNDDRVILGRKLFVIYNKRNPDKVEYFKRVMNELENLEEVTFACFPDGAGGYKWSVFMGDIRAFMPRKGEADQFQIREEPNPLNLVAWLTVNNVATSKTYIYFYNEQALPLPPRNIRHIMGLAASFFHKLDLTKIDREDLLGDAYVTRVLAVVNFASSPDADSVETVHVIYSNSWGEVFCHFHDPESGIEKIAQLAIEAGNRFNIGDRKYFRLFVPESARDNNISTAFIERLAAKLPEGTFNIHSLP